MPESTATFRLPSLSLLLLWACSDDGVPSPTASPTGSQVSESSQSVPDPDSPRDPEKSAQRPSDQFEALRQEVLAQAASLRQAELDVMAPPFNEFVSVPSPVPAEIPGPDGHPWTPADTENFGMLSWGPDNGKGITHAQFHVELSSDGSNFTVIATMDLDGDGIPSRVLATKDTEPYVEDSSIW
jgi:hypothetical protein